MAPECVRRVLLAGRVRSSGFEDASRRRGQTPNHYPARDWSESEAARKKPEVNLVQIARQGKEGVAGCLGSG